VLKKNGYQGIKFISIPETESFMAVHNIERFDPSTGKSINTFRFTRASLPWSSLPFLQKVAAPFTDQQDYFRAYFFVLVPNPEGPLAVAREYSADTFDRYLSYVPMTALPDGPLPTNASLVVFVYEFMKAEGMALIRVAENSLTNDFDRHLRGSKLNTILK
jgi:hypothetical protein